VREPSRRRRGRQGRPPNARRKPRGTFTFDLERADGTPAEPPSFETTGALVESLHTIPLGPNGTLQVVRVRDNDEPGRPADDEALF
jgi:hypothetical protein